MDLLTGRDSKFRIVRVAAHVPTVQATRGTLERCSVVPLKCTTRLFSVIKLPWNMLSQVQNVATATDSLRLHGPAIESRWVGGGGKISRTRPDRP